MDKCIKISIFIYIFTFIFNDYVYCDNFVNGGCKNIKNNEFVEFIDSSIKWSMEIYLSYEDIKYLGNKELIYSNINLKGKEENYKLNKEMGEYFIYKFSYSFKYKMYKVYDVEYYKDGKILKKSWYSPDGKIMDYFLFLEDKNIKIHFNDLGIVRFLEITHKQIGTSLYVFDNKNEISSCSVK